MVIYLRSQLLSDRPFFQPRLKRAVRNGRFTWSCTGWGLPCHRNLRFYAVRSYHTFSPLLLTCVKSGLFSVALSVAFLHPAFTGILLFGVRTFLIPSHRDTTIRPTSFIYFLHRNHISKSYCMCHTELLSPFSLIQKVFETEAW